MVTSKQIAELAGVSRGTVDRVLNNRGRVRAHVKQKILDIVKSLDYHPGRAGRLLVSHQKNLKIGCIIINARNSFYDELASGVMQKVEEYATYGIEVIVRRIDFNADAQCAYIDTLIEQGVRALMIQPVDEERIAKKLLTLSDMGIPVVTTNTNVRGFSPFCYVGNDFFSYGKTAANLLDIITDGICDIGIVTGFHNARSHAERIEGFIEYCRSVPRMRVCAVVENFDDDEISFNITEQLLAGHPRMNALFLVAGGVAGAGRALKKNAASARIKTICFDDLPATKDLMREGIILAAICQEPVRQGFLSMEILFDYLIYNKKPSPPYIYTDIHIKLKSNI